MRFIKGVEVYRMTHENREEWTYYHYKDLIEAELARSVAFLGDKNKLRDATEYALMNGGKRLRPVLAMMVADAQGNDLSVLPVALCTEYFHTASLIADDLPCMDDDDERRGKPSTHKVFGETIALLASYGLYMSAFEKITENGDLMTMKGEPFSSKASEAVRLGTLVCAQSGGFKGAVGGQFWDLFPPNRSFETTQEINHKKTATLFEAAFVLGWLFGGGESSRVEDVKKCAYHLGMAFQAADDLGDMKQDAENGCSTNIALSIGKEKAVEYFSREMHACRVLLKELKLETSALLSVCGRVEALAEKNKRL